MGKSPGKWIKTVFFGKKSSKSNLSKDVTSEIKTSVTGKTTSKDDGADSMVISSPVRPVIVSSGERTELEKSSSANLMPDTAENQRNPVESNVADGDELIRLDEAARKVQAAFRGYLARRAFWALKGIIRLQALVRGHLVRRQAVATLSCMRAIIELQALARGRRVRFSNSQLLVKHTPTESVVKKPADLLGTSLRVEKLSKNVFVTKLVASSRTTTPLTIQYEPTEPNSVRSWLARWSSTHFWDPLPQPKQPLDAKPRRKHHKLQTEETETGIVRPKRSVRKVTAPNNDSNGISNSSENEKSRRTVRKVNPQADPGQGQDQSLTELEKVKRNLRKISVSTSKPPEKSEVDPEKTSPDLTKVSASPTPDFSDKNNGSINGSNFANVKQPEPEPKPEQEPEPEPEEPPVQVQAPDDKPLDQPPIEPPSQETNGKQETEPPSNVELNVKENQKTRRRKSLPAKQEYHESVPQNTPTLPSYMAATESAKAKLRAQAAAKAAEEGGEDGLTRRKSLPSSTGKAMLHSPRVQKPLHANGKGGTKPNKSQISPRDEKVVQAGWRR